MDRKSERAAEALQIVAGLPKDPVEGLATLAEAKRAYELFLTEYGLCHKPPKRELPRWFMAAAIGIAAIGLWETVEISTEAVAHHSHGLSVCADTVNIP